MEKLRIVVEWDEEEDDEYIVDQKLFQQSIENYIERFNALPPIGMHISNGRCDAGKIEQINYNGVDNILWVFLCFV